MVIALSGYSAYFDASMDKGKTEVLVAGYASTLEEWAQFEIAWRLTLGGWPGPAHSRLTMRVPRPSSAWAGILVGKSREFKIPTLTSQRTRR
jgi:hypothetical protein